MSTSASGHRPGPRTRTGRIFLGLLFVLVMVVYPLLMVFIMLDGTRQQWVTCEVTHAETAKGNRFSTSEWMVAIETTDCGRMIYSQGVTEDNIAEIAASFDPEEYEFKLGIASRSAVDGWLPFLRPTVRDYRPIE